MGGILIWEYLTVIRDGSDTYLDQICPVWYLDLARPAMKDKIYF